MRTGDATPHQIALLLSPQRANRTRISEFSTSVRQGRYVHANTGGKGRAGKKKERKMFTMMTQALQNSADKSQGKARQGKAR